MFPRLQGGSHSLKVRFALWSHTRGRQRTWQAFANHALGIAVSANGEEPINKRERLKPNGQQGERVTDVRKQEELSAKHILNKTATG